MASAFPGVLALNGGETRDELRKALADGHAHHGLAVIHVPVYGGSDPVGGLGVYGAWNVGNWVVDVEDRYVRSAI